MSDEILSPEEIEALLAGVNNSGEAQSQPVQTPAPVSETPKIEMLETHHSTAAAKSEAKNENNVQTVQFAPLDASANTGMVNGVDLILDVQLQVSVELGKSLMKVKDVLSLGPGSVVELDKHAGEPVEVIVNNKTVARGEVVVIDENFGVRITEIVSSQKRDANAKAA